MSTHLVTAIERPNGGMDFKKIKPTPEQEVLLATLKVEFEKAFGADQAARTTAQWRNLVRVYGLEKVCAIEKMTEKEVKTKLIG